MVCRAMKALKILKDHRNGPSKSGESGASNMNLAKSSDPFPGTGRHWDSLTTRKLRLYLSSELGMQ